MAGFGFAKPKAVSVQPGQVPSFKDLSWPDRLMMLGAAFQNDREGMMAVPMMAAARARQAEQQTSDEAFRRAFMGEGVPMLVRPPEREKAPERIPSGMEAARETLLGGLGEDAGFGAVPRYESPKLEVDDARVPMVVRGPGGQKDIRELAGMLLERAQKGFPIADQLKVLELTKPKATVVNGRVLNENDQSIYGQFYGEPPTKGARPAYDENKRQIGWVLENGTLEALSQTSEATELGKTRGGIIDVPMSDGTTVPMTGGEYLDTRAGRGAAAASGGFGVKPSPAQTKLETDRAGNQAEVEKMTPKATAALDTLDRKTNFVLGKLREALGQAEGGIGGSTGLNSLLSGIPQTKAFDLQSTLDTIEASIGFDELQQMRDNSPTGGAVGNLTERELGLLSSLRGSLKAGQSEEQLRRNIEGAITELERVRNERRSAFDRQFNAASQAPGQGGARWTPEQARAELERRRRERAGQ